MKVFKCLHQSNIMDVCSVEDAELEVADVEEFLQIFRLLSNPIRLKIALLIKNKERCVCELERALKIDQTLVSHHLRSFKEIDVVNERRAGKWRYYKLKDENLKKVLSII